MYAEESLAYCSGQCQASRYPPASCRCPCLGRNHGILRYSHHSINVTPSWVNDDTRLPVQPGEYFLPGQRQVLGLPEIRARVRIDPGINPPVKGPRGHSLSRKIGRSLKHSIIGYSQSELNESIVKGLRYQFSQERVDAVIDQAYATFFSHDPDRNRPELYELYENGDIDRALELFSVRWVIGRPKLRR